MTAFRFFVGSFRITKTFFKFRPMVYERHTADGTYDELPRRVKPTLGKRSSFVILQRRNCEPSDSKANDERGWPRERQEKVGTVGHPGGASQPNFNALRNQSKSRALGWARVSGSSRRRRSQASIYNLRETHSPKSQILGVHEANGCPNGHWSLVHRNP
ncbi:hypothetical protein PM082_011988 [Marasmius tenuissimus]|nr:hypothetical protein PM082_011988 [Marasmius tenuissimus]